MADALGYFHLAMGCRAEIRKVALANDIESQMKHKSSRRRGSISR
jgi:hypothetical protein